MGIEFSMLPSDAGGNTPLSRFLLQAWATLPGPGANLPALSFSGKGDLASVFAVTDLASAAVGVAGLAIAQMVALEVKRTPAVHIDRRLASLWFGSSLRPQGWAMPPVWDAIAGHYRAADGWVRLHTNAAHHRDAALAVLGTPADRDRVAKEVARWDASALEAAIVEQGGCAAAMRSQQAWAEHPQGQSVQAEPLLQWALAEPVAKPAWHINLQRPLQGIRVLDLTRILAGPVATRFLAGFGADVLRIDPPSWDEPNAVPEVTLGKRCARLDLRTREGMETLEGLMRHADVVVHGLRPQALDRLGLSAQRRRELNPGLVDVSLDAYGWSGPWKERRGFDSLVQMSTGIADAGMRYAGAECPVPLPVQAIDHATGYLMAAAVVRGLVLRCTTGQGCEVRASLARTAHWLMEGKSHSYQEPLEPEMPQDQDSALEQTAWGPARRLKPPLVVSGASMHWQSPAVALGSGMPRWM